MAAFDLSDPLEWEIADVGIVAMEDAETGQLRWVDTGNADWRREFGERVADLERQKGEVFAAAGVDRVRMSTGEDYVARIAAFFRDRLRRPAR